MPKSGATRSPPNCQRALSSCASTSSLLPAEGASSPAPWTVLPPPRDPGGVYSANCADTPVASPKTSNPIVVARVRPFARQSDLPAELSCMAGILRQPETIPATLLALLVVAAPLPFGSVQTWARTTLALGILFCFVVAVAWVPRSKNLRKVALPAVCVAGIGLLGLVQTVPLPAALVETLSPRHAAAFARAAEVVPDELGGDAVATTLSLAPAETRSVAYWWLTVAAGLVAAALSGTNRRERRLLLIALVLVVGFEILYGARQVMFGSLEVWGIEVLGVRGRLRGTYVNPNHTASLLVMALMSVFGWGWWAWRQARRDRSWERRLLLLLPPAVVGMGILLGIAMTRSRAGLAAAAAGALFGTALAALEARNRRAVALVVIVAALVVVGALAGTVGLEQAFGRILSTSLYEVGWGARTQVYGETLGLWLDYPILGSGLGTFADAFPTVQPATLHGSWEHAHNDPLELLATTGLIGGALAVLGVLALALRLRHVQLHGFHTEDRAAGLAGLCILVALAVHELLDFGLTVPANALVAVALLGAAAVAPTREVVRR